MANGNFVSDIVTGVGMLADSPQTWQQRADENDAIATLTSAIKVRDREQSNIRAANRERRSAEDHAHTSLGRLLTAYTTKALEILGDTDLKEPDVDDAMISVFESINSLRVDSRFERKDFQTLIDGAEIVMRNTVKSYKKSQLHMSLLKETYNKVTDLQVGGKLEGKVGSAGMYSSISSSNATGSIIANNAKMIEYFSEEGLQTAVGVVEKMGEDYAKKLYLERMLNSLDINKLKPFVQWDNEAPKYGVEVREMISQVEAHINAGQWEEGYDLIVKIDAEIDADRKTLVGAMEGMDKWIRKARRANVEQTVSQMNELFPQISEQTAVKGLGLINAKNFSTTKDLFIDQNYFNALGMDVDIISNMMSTGKEGMVKYFTEDIQDKVEVLEKEGRLQYAGGFIRRLDGTNQFVWNDHLSTPYTNKSGKVGGLSEWGYDPEVMRNMDIDRVLQSRTDLAKMINSKKIIADDKTQDISEAEKRILVDYMGIIIGDYFNHPLNMTVKGRKEAAKDINEEYFKKGWVGREQTIHNAKISVGVKKLNSMLEGNTKERIVELIKEWRRDNKDGYSDSMFLEIWSKWSLDHGGETDE